MDRPGRRKDFVGINFSGCRYSEREYRLNRKRSIQKRINEGEDIVLPFPLTLTSLQAKLLSDQIRDLRRTCKQFKEIYNKQGISEYNCDSTILWFITTPFVALLKDNTHIKKYFVDFCYKPKKSMVHVIGYTLDNDACVSNFIYKEIKKSNT